MSKRSESAVRAWETIRKKYGDNGIAKKAWETRKQKIYGAMTEEEYGKYLISQYNDEENKNIRRLVLKSGGVRDTDYELIPRWAKRKNGRTLDVIVSELKEEGIPLNGADDLYTLIQEVSA